jgi:hypothetical protein
MYLSTHITTRPDMMYTVHCWDLLYRQDLLPSPPSGASSEWDHFHSIKMTHSVYLDDLQDSSFKSKIMLGGKKKICKSYSILRIYCRAYQQMFFSSFIITINTFIKWTVVGHSFANYLSSTRHLSKHWGQIG